jgi:hypothetical protein
MMLQTTNDPEEEKSWRRRRIDEKFNRLPSSATSVANGQRDDRVGQATPLVFHPANTHALMLDFHYAPHDPRWDIRRTETDG